MPREERQFVHLPMGTGIVDRALFGYSEADAQRDARDLEAFERIVAAIDLATVRPTEPMPAHVRSRVLAEAAAWINEGASNTDGADENDDDGTDDAADIEPIAFPRSTPWTPWLVAAACLVIAVISTFDGRSTTTPGSMDESPTAIAMYEQLTTSPGDTVLRVPWTDVQDSGVTGEIVWDAAKQRGVLQINGLTANDPSITQYQLWIFDEQRKAFSEFDAVDGGVFDVASNGTHYVTINAALDVGSPYLFAVTNEPPGGVVKHVDDDKHRILLVAPVPSAGPSDA